MKTFLLFLTLSIAPGYYFGHHEIIRHFINAAISKSPAFAPAVFDSIEKSGWKKFSSIRVRFKFIVNDKEYFARTTPTDQKGALNYISAPDLQVAYSSNDPSINTLRKYYDLKHTTGTLWQSIVIVSLITTVIALPPTLLLAWLFGWFKRKKSVSKGESASLVTQS